MSEATVPCDLCGKPTAMTGTPRRCDGCWEVERRLGGFVASPAGRRVALEALGLEVLSVVEAARAPEQPGPPLEVLSMPVISTRHLSCAEAQRKSGEWPTTCFENEYGFIAYFGTVADLENTIVSSAGDECDPADVWPGFLSAARWAEAHGFQWIRFDRDADEQPGLRAWEW